MNATTDSLDHDEFNRPTLPSFLNVLTILTFIGSAIQIILAVWGFFSSKSSYENKDKIVEQMSTPGAPSFIKKLMGDPQEFLITVTKSYENRIPILIISLVAAGLCIWGAMQMRELKKQGFLIYTIGEILGLLGSLVFVGIFIVKGIGFMFGAAVVILFIGMYAANRKHLVY
jgi:hypothetical protein